MNDLKIVIKNIYELKAYEKNAKKHNKKQIEAVAKSIEQFGFVQPLVIDKNNEIVIGHCRCEASKLLGMTEVPCVCVDELTDEQVKALRLADNKLNESEWDNKLLLEELELLGEDAFTGFWWSEIFDTTLLDEQDNSVLDENEKGVTYKIQFECPNKEIVEKAKELLENLLNEA